MNKEELKENIGRISGDYTDLDGVMELIEDFVKQEIDRHLLKMKSFGEEYSKDSNCDCNYLNGWNDCLKEIKKYLN